MKRCGVILAGGKSSRMGTNKSLLKLKNQTVIEIIANELEKCVQELVVIANEKPDYEFLNLPLYMDRYTGLGPLAGMEAAMYHVKADVFLFAACDMPFINTQVYDHLLSQLAKNDAVVPVFAGQMHPLSGIYRRTVRPMVEKQLLQQELRVKSFFDHIQIRYVDDFEGIPEAVLQKHFFNMNNPSQYEQAKSF